MEWPNSSYTKTIHCIEAWFLVKENDSLNMQKPIKAVHLCIRFAGFINLSLKYVLC